MRGYCFTLLNPFITTSINSSFVIVGSMYNGRENSTTLVRLISWLYYVLKVGVEMSCGCFWYSSRKCVGVALYIMYLLLAQQ